IATNLQPEVLRLFSPRTSSPAHVHLHVRVSAPHKRQEMFPGINVVLRKTKNRWHPPMRVVRKKNPSLQFHSISRGNHAAHPYAVTRSHRLPRTQRREPHARQHREANC